MRGELRPIEAMAVFRRAATAGDWDTVRSMLAEDEEAAQASIRVQKGWNDDPGGWLLVPVAESVRDDVAVVIVNQRTLRGGPSLRVPFRADGNGRWALGSPLIVNGRTGSCHPHRPIGSRP